MPWRHGILHLERHPELIATSGTGEPSRYWEVATDPLIAGMRRRITQTLAGTEYRVERAQLPPWLEGDWVAQAAADLQHAYCARLFYSWMKGGRRGFKKFVRDAVRTTLIEGWSWFELVGQWRVVDFGVLGRHRVLWLDVPEWRAPWSVRWWLHQHEQLVGVIAGFQYSTDYLTGHTGDWQVTLPAAKMLIVNTDAVGSNHLGRSWLRDIYNYLLAKQQGFRLEGLSAEVNGVGELFFQLDGTVSEDNQKALQNYIITRKGAHAPGAVLPKGIEPVRVKGELVDYSPYLNRLDKQLGQSWNQDDRSIATDGHGSYAAREVASADGRDAMDDIAGELVVEPTEEVFERVIRASFPDLAAAGHVYPPTLGYGQVEERDNGTYVEMIGAAKSNGLLTWTAQDEVDLRELIDLRAIEVRPPL